MRLYCIVKDEIGKKYIAEQIETFGKFDIENMVKGNKSLFDARKILYSEEEISGDFVITKDEKERYNHYILSERQKINNDEKIILEGVSISEAKKLTGAIF